MILNEEVYDGIEELCEIIVRRATNHYDGEDLLLDISKSIKNWASHHLKDSPEYHKIYNGISTDAFSFDEIGKHKTKSNGRKILLRVTTKDLDNLHSYGQTGRHIKDRNVIVITIPIFYFDSDKDDEEKWEEAWKRFYKTLTHEIIHAIDLIKEPMSKMASQDFLNKENLSSKDWGQYIGLKVEFEQSMQKFLRWAKTHRVTIKTYEQLLMLIFGDPDWIKGAKANPTIKNRIAKKFKDEGFPGPKYLAKINLGILGKNYFPY